jgi:hypothetical protein
MKFYSDSGQKLLPRTPVIVEVVPETHDVSVFKGGKFLTEVLCGVLEGLEAYGSIFGYTDFSVCSVLLLDYPDWDNFKFRDPQKLSSLAASWASLSAGDREVPFSAKSFNLPKDEVVNYFAWRQMSLAGDFLRMENLKTDPDNVLRFVEDGPESRDRMWPGTWWRGRACTRVQAPAVDMSTRRPVFFWDIDTETPVFSAHREYINDLVYLPK